MSAFKHLLLSSNGAGILTITMNRPKVNAMSVEFLTELVAAFRQADADPSLRGVLLKSSSPVAFSAGLDLKSVYELCASKKRPEIESFFHGLLSDAMQAPLACSKPVAAVVEGHAIAGGMILALACDYIGLSSERSFTVALSELQVGVAFPVAPFQIVQRQLGPSAARKFVLDAANFDPKSAFELGFGNALVSKPEQAALDWLGVVSSRPLKGFSIAKRMWWDAYLPSAGSAGSLGAVGLDKQAYFEAVTSEDALRAMQRALERGRK